MDLEKIQSSAVSTAECRIILRQCNVEEEILKLKIKNEEKKDVSARSMVPWLPRNADFKIPQLLLPESTFSK